MTDKRVGVCDGVGFNVALAPFREHTPSWGSAFPGAPSPSSACGEARHSLLSRTWRMNEWVSGIDVYSQPQRGEMRKPRATPWVSSPKTFPSPERAPFHVTPLGLRMVRALNRWATHRNHPAGGPMSGCLRLICLAFRPRQPVRLNSVGEETPRSSQWRSLGFARTILVG